MCEAAPRRRPFRRDEACVEVLWVRTSCPRVTRRRAAALAASVLAGIAHGGSVRKGHAHGTAAAMLRSEGHPDAVTDRTMVAAYHFPNDHRDPRSDVWYGTGWTEWELVKA